MLNNEQMISLAEFIKTHCQKDSKDLIDALSFVNLALDGVYDSVNDIVNSHISSRALNKLSPLLEKMETVIELKKSVDEYILMLEDEEALEEEIEAENMDEETEKKQIPNYALYTVDNSIPHSLNENFTHTKACGFEFKGKKYETRDMRDVLVKLCSILAQEDINKMQSFINDPTMKGTKVSYFGNIPITDVNIKTNQEVYKNRLIPKTSIYVWVHFSANDLAKMIMRVLKKYSYENKDIKIFLKADYKELHNKKSNDIECEPHQDNGNEKIGQYIANIMRDLSISNYQFTQNELIAFQSKDWTKQTFGIGMPFLKKYDETKSVSEQIKINQNNRYWKDRYTFNGEEYFVVSQWYEKHREKFEIWLKQLDREV